MGESLENEFDFDEEPLNVLVPEANYHVIEIWANEKTLEEISSKTEKEVKTKSEEKGKGKEKAKTNEKTNETAKGKA